MRMVARPWQGTRLKPVDAVNFAHVEPAPEAVKRPGAGHKPPASLPQLRLPENPEKQEQVAASDALIAQMPLGGSCLPQHRPPAVCPRKGIGHQIRVKVGPVRTGDPAASQITGNLAQPTLPEVNLIVANTGLAIGNGQRAQ